MCFILFPLEVPNWSPLPPECSDWEILLEEKGFLFTFPRVLPCLTSLPGEDVSTDPRLSNPVGLFPLLSLVALQHRYTHQPSLRSTVRSLVLPYPLTIKEQHKLSSGGARPVCRGKICLCSWKSVSMCMCVCGSWLPITWSDTELEPASQTAPEIHLSLVPNTEVPRGACHTWMLHSRWWEFRLSTQGPVIETSLTEPFPSPMTVFINVTLKYSVCIHGLYFPWETSPTLHTQPIIFV